MDYGKFKVSSIAAKDCKAPSGFCIQGDFAFIKSDYPCNILKDVYYVDNKGNTKYQLTGVITHLGVSGPNGHFLAFCKNPLNGKWFKYNDEKITDASTYEVHNEGVAYILFYNIIKPKHQK